MDQKKLSSNLNKIFAAISPINLQITQCVSQSLVRLSTEFGSFSRNRSRVRAENPFPFERIESKVGLSKVERIERPTKRQSETQQGQAT